MGHLPVSGLNLPQNRASYSVASFGRALAPGPPSANEEDRERSGPPESGLTSEQQAGSLRPPTPARFQGKEQKSSVSTDHHPSSSSSAPGLPPLHTPLSPILEFCLCLVLLFLSLAVLFALGLSEADFRLRPPWGPCPQPPSQCWVATDAIATLLSAPSLPGGHRGSQDAAL